MFELLAEKPMVVTVLLGSVAAIAIYGWLQTGKREAGGVGLFAVALIPVAWLVASSWETDREAVTRVIYETAEHIENNRFDEVYEVIAEPRALQMAKSELPRLRFDLARVNQIRSIKVVEGSYPPEILVDMSAKVNVSVGRLVNQRVLRRLELKFHKVDEKWVVVDYRHQPVTGGPDQYSNLPAR